MRDDEHRSLAGVRDEYAYLNDLVHRQPLVERAVAANLEATYLIRLYVTFGELLRRRLAMSANDESSLVNCVQRLSGDQVGYDPADEGRALSWWRLFRRDRNLLAHGRGIVPALDINATRTLMEVYLSGLKS